MVHILALEKAAKYSTSIFQVWNVRSYNRATWYSKPASSTRQNCWQDWLQDWCFVLIHLLPSCDTLYWEKVTVWKGLPAIFEGTAYYRELHYRNMGFGYDSIPRIWHLNTRKMLAGFSRTEKQSLTDNLKIYIKKIILSYEPFFLLFTS